MRGEDRFIGYYEAHGENLHHYVTKLKERGYVFGTHYLPHDAEHKRLGDYNKSTQDMLEELMPGQRFEIVPRVTQLITGIQQTRKAIKGVYFDEAGTRQGIDRLSGYRKKYSRADNRYTDEPDKSNGCSEGADAFRQFAQAKELGMLDYTPAVQKRYEQAEPPDWRL